MRIQVYPFRSRLVLGSVFMVAVISGCTTVGSLRPGSEKAHKLIVKGKSYDQIWKAAIKVLSRKLNIVEANKALGIIKAEKGPSLFSWGEVAGVFISPASRRSSQYQIEVLSEKKCKTELFSTQECGTVTIVEQIKLELGIP